VFVSLPYVVWGSVIQSSETRERGNAARLGARKQRFVSWETQTLFPDAVHPHLINPSTCSPCRKPQITYISVKKFSFVANRTPPAGSVQQWTMCADCSMTQYRFTRAWLCLLGAILSEGARSVKHLYSPSWLSLFAFFCVTLRLYLKQKNMETSVFRHILSPERNAAFHNHTKQV
jgi:hypothetical protein